MECKEYFEENAINWEEMRQDFFSEDVCEAALDMAKVISGQSAVDVGAGSGFLSRGLVKRGLSVISVDQSESMLKELSARLPQADCRVGESLNLPVEDSSVHHAFANMYLHHVPDPAAAIKEMARIIKPSGNLIITDLDEHEHEFLRNEHHDRWLGFKREDVESWLIKAGLENVTISCVGSNCCATSCNSNAEANISIFLAKGEKKRDAAKACCSCRNTGPQTPIHNPEKVASRSRELFDQGYFCSESVLMALAETYGKNLSGMCDLMTGFGGGIARSGGMCGALSGGIAAIGMLFGRKDTTFSKDECYTLTYNLVKEFGRRFGSTSCSGVLGCDISTIEGAENFATQGLEETICARVTEESAGLLQELINNRENLTHPLSAKKD